MRGSRCPGLGYALPALPPKQKQGKFESQSRKKFMLRNRSLHSVASCFNEGVKSTVEISVTCVTNLHYFRIQIREQDTAKSSRNLCCCQASQERPMCYSLVAGARGPEKILIRQLAGMPEQCDPDGRRQEIDIRVQLRIIAAAQVERAVCACEVAFSSSAHQLCISCSRLMCCSPLLETSR